jgi:hypothetical protein
MGGGEETIDGPEPAVTCFAIVEVAEMSVRDESKGYLLEVPLDASGIEGFVPDREVKVLVLGEGVPARSATVQLDTQGKGSARFAFDGRPGALQVYVGPADAADDELPGLQTIAHRVAARRWTGAARLKLPVVIPPYHWWWWRRWCRTFVVRGRVLCPDGAAIPGAQVCAYDVDAWWWWSSRQLVGCGTTDVNGAFEIRFRWCCGWWPWRWWRQRVWALEPFLLERILPELQRLPDIGPVPPPDPTPDIRIFRALLGEDRVTALNLAAQPAPLFVQREPISRASLRAAGRDQIGAKVAPISAPTSAPISAWDPGAETGIRRRMDMQTGAIERLREEVVARLPKLTGLEALRIWPWSPRLPWWDCAPDLIFRVTQDCGVPGNVIVEEGYGDTRWNVDTETDLTLVANDSACCIADQDDEPEGICALITDVCHSPINAIGGNPGAAATPAGYLSPGLADTTGDRPFGGAVLIQGQIGSTVDYYEPEVSDDDGLTWTPLPHSALADIPRLYWIPATDTFVSVPFLHTVDGRRVFESRPHYEATHDPTSWDVSRYWMVRNYGALLRWQTATPFLNGRYRLRLRGWQLAASGQLVNDVVLPTCSIASPAELVLRIDNRLVGAGSGHPPSVPDHPCGAGTVHTCTLEPATDFVAVRIVRLDGSQVPVSACGNVPVGPNDVLEVDFYAHDPEGHLAYYTLHATYGENLDVNLLDPAAVPSLTDATHGLGLFPLGGLAVAAAAQVGPKYGQARAQGAAAPVWHGGGLRLRVKATEVFPRTCCYQLELRAHKRTVVDCGYSLWHHTNYSEYGFMVVVAAAAPPVPVPMLPALETRRSE